MKKSQFSCTAISRAAGTTLVELMIAIVISLLIFIAGLLAMFQLPISEYPDVSPPSVVVNASYPGANPKVIAETVARPLDEKSTIFFPLMTASVPS